MGIRISLLGTGDAAQVPVYNCGCTACERARSTPRHRRRPCSALVECGAQRWLIDSGLPDLAERFPPGSFDGILQTHYHADHAQGLLHLRWGEGLRIPVLGPPDPDGLADLYKWPGILDFSRVLHAFETVALGPLRITPVPLAHSKLTYGYVLSCGRRRVAYLTDTVGLPDDTASHLRHERPDLLILDCSFPPSPQTPRNHNDLTRALRIAESLAVEQTVLTHAGHRLDAWLMEHPDALPAGVRMGHDGDVFELG